MKDFWGKSASLMSHNSGELHESLCNWGSNLEDSEDLVLEAYIVHEHYLIFISFCVLLYET